VQYRQVSSKDIYIAGADLGLPITILPDKGRGLSWQLTPWLTTGIGASHELAQGGYLYGGGGTSSLNYRVGALLLTLGDQVSWEGGTPIGYSSFFDLKQSVHQTMLKNGILATYDIAPPYFVDLGVNWTNFLEGAFDHNYFTVLGGGGVRFNDTFGLRLNFLSDLANQYRSYGGEALLYFNF
jgi:hypothetical protein